MTAYTRRAVRATATLAGVAAFGATFCGTAFAADQNHTTTANLSDSADGSAHSDPLDTANALSGPGTGFLDFALPTSGPSLAPAKKHSDYDDESGGSSAPYTGGRPHHYHPGSNEPPYDYDLYSPTETYGPNKCKSKGADRHPAGASAGGIGGYNGDSAADCKVDSGDYHPKRTGYQGTDRKGDNGYSGYLGSDSKRQNENKFLFSLPGS
jgi:hypothetical protein